MFYSLIASEEVIRTQFLSLETSKLRVEIDAYSLFLFRYAEPFD